MIRLSHGEKTLLAAVEAGNYESVLTESSRQALLATPLPKTSISISAEEGMPYQTLVASIIHKYISSSLQDRPARKRR